MEAAAGPPWPCPAAGCPGQDSGVPAATGSPRPISLFFPPRQGERQQTQHAVCQLTHSASYFCVCRTTKMLHFQGNTGGARLPVSPGQGLRHWSLRPLRGAAPAPTLCTMEVLGPAEVHRDGEVLRYQHSPGPPRFTAVIPENRKKCACFSAAAEQLQNAAHQQEHE